MPHHRRPPTPSDQRHEPALDAAPADPSRPPRPPAAPPRRWLRRLLWTLLALVLAALGALAGLWWWLGQPQSIAHSLALAQRWLPAEQQLTFEQAEGSIRHGGHIGDLRWQGPGLSLHLQALTLDWELSALLLRQHLLVDRLHLQALHVRSTGSTPDAESEPPRPLSHLLLPLRAIHLPLQIDQLTWGDAPNAALQDLQARYQYDGEQHQIQLTQLRYDQGHYQAQAQLQASAPLHLQAQVDGQLQPPADLLEQPMHIQAQVTLDGPLAGADAALQLHAQAHEAPAPQTTTQPEGEHAAAPAAAATPSSSPDSTALRVQAQALIQPWQAQPLPQAQIELQNVNLARFAPSLPRTDLHGHIQARPGADTDSPLQSATPWTLHADLRNPLAAPWDQQALPVHHLQAQLLWDGPRWLLQQLQIQLAPQPDSHGHAPPEGGHIQAQAEYDSDNGQLQAQAQLRALDPAQLLSSLARQSLQGHLEVRTQLTSNHTTAQDVEDGENGKGGESGENATNGADGEAAPPIHFTLDIQDSHSKPAHGLQHARAQGQWQANTLTLQDLDIAAFQAQLRGPRLQWQQDEQRLDTELALQLPGASAQLHGHLSHSDGQGQLQLDVAALPQLLDWAGHLPGMQPLDLPLQGQAQAHLQWQGGWGKLAERFSQPAQPRQQHAASGLQLSGHLHLPQLSHTPADGPASQVQDLRLLLEGTPERLQAELSTQARHDQHQLRLHTQLQAGLAARGQPLDWQATLEQLQIHAQPDGQPGDWQLQLTQAFTVAQNGTRLRISPSALDITPPGTAQPATATTTTTAAATPPANGDSQPPNTSRVQWGDIALTQAHATAGRKVALDGAILGWHLQTQGQIQHLPLAWVDLFSPDPQRPLLASAGIGGDLVLRGQWDIDTTLAQPLLHVRLENASGDLRLAAASAEDTAPVTIVRSSGASPARQSTLRPGVRGRRVGLQHLHLELGLQGHDLTVQGLWASERAGTILAQLNSPLQRSRDGGWAWPEDAPISGTIQTALPDLGLWAMFAPPGWRVEGQMGSDIRLSGTRADPQWQGDLRADSFGISSLLDGVNLHNGQLRARFAGTRIDIEHLQLEGGGGNQARILGRSGNLTAPPQEGGRIIGSGYMAYQPDAPGSGLDMDIQLQAQQLQVLVRTDRQIGLSGQVSARLHDEQLRLRGQLTVDRAALLLADESAPGLDDDVHVHSAASRRLEAEQQAEAERLAARQPPQAGTVRAAIQPDIDLTLDLGPDFALQGYGITTRLAGQLHIRNGPRITGEINTVQGRFRAWGQSLDVEQGIIRFNGPYDNPSLDIIALRPNLPVRAGAKVLGSASAPVVSLFSEPDMPDAEKLSWIVMGRDPAEGGAESALLQQAALAMLSSKDSNFAGQVGLDEIGFKGGGDGTNGAALTLGKRISQDLYLSYEQSLSGAMGTLFMFYDLTRRLTLRGQTGEQTAIDLIYTYKKD